MRAKTRPKMSDEERRRDGQILLTDADLPDTMEIRGALRVTQIVALLFRALDAPCDEGLGIVWNEEPVTGSFASSTCFGCAPSGSGRVLIGLHYATPFGVFFYSEDHAPGCGEKQLVFLAAGSFAETIEKVGVAG